jgi:hypothetical protein
VNKAKKQRYEAPWWSVELPVEWSARADTECATFTSVKLEGALQLSAYRKDSDIDQKELFELADERPVPDTVKIGSFAGLCNTYEKEGTRWKKWWLVKHRTLVFATYNGPAPIAEAEIRVVEGVLQTLQARQ